MLWTLTLVKRSTESHEAGSLESVDPSTMASYPSHPSHSASSMSNSPTNSTNHPGSGSGSDFPDTIRSTENGHYVDIQKKSQMHGFSSEINESNLWFPLPVKIPPNLSPSATSITDSTPDNLSMPYLQGEHFYSSEPSVSNRLSFNHHRPTSSSSSSNSSQSSLLIAPRPMRQLTQPIHFSTPYERAPKRRASSGDQPSLSIFTNDIQREHQQDSSNSAILSSGSSQYSSTSSSSTFNPSTIVKQGEGFEVVSKGESSAGALYSPESEIGRAAAAVRSAQGHAAIDTEKVAFALVWYVHYPYAPLFNPQSHPLSL